jgi:hypothetical protein
MVERWLLCARLRPFTRGKMAEHPSSDGGGRGWAVVLLCVPCVLGTAVLGALSGESPANVSAWLAVLFFLMAAYGPALLLAAAPLAVSVSKRPQTPRQWVVIVWAAIAIALLATALFYRRIISLAPLP